MNARDVFGSPGCALQYCRNRINQAGALLILFLFVGGSMTGWILRGIHNDGWRIGPVPNRWHPVTLVNVVDGDTIKVKWKGEITPVRLINIDTAERNEPGYEAATTYLKSMLRGATAVMMEFEKDGVHARDRFGRLLCYVWLNGKCLNVEMVRAGHSPFYTKYGAGKYPAKFREAIREAQVRSEILMEPWSP